MGRPKFDFHTGTAKQEAEAFIEGTLEPVVDEEDEEDEEEVVEVTPESVACCVEINRCVGCTGSVER